MKRICNFILLLCLVQLAVAQNRIAETEKICWEIIQIKYWLYPTGADWRNAPGKLIARYTELH